MFNRILQGTILCGSLIAINASAFWVNSQFDGQWVEVGNADARRGLNMQFIKTGPRDAGALFFTAFTYDNDGNQIWLTGNAGGVTPGVDTFEVPMFLFEGGEFFAGGDGAVSGSAIANFTIQVNSCDSMTVSWTSTGTPDVGSGSAEFDRGSSSNSVLAVGPDRCVYQQEPQACPAFSTPVFGRICALNGTITEDTTLTNNIVWQLDGAVFVGDDNANSAALTIEPGTYIFGAGGGDALVVRRGSQVFAVGTPFAPIVLTSSSDITGGNPIAGDVGGFALFGNAPTNACVDPLPECNAAFEGLTGEVFGGDDPEDNSGILKYVQVRFGGNPIVPDQELNALTLSGIGRGTKISYVQTHSGQDDGIELFGGTVNLDHIVMTGTLDDSFDTDLGWRGYAQYGVIVQDAASNDKGFEMDGNPNSNNSEPPFTRPRVANFTMIGKGGLGDNNGINLRTGTKFEGYNLFIDNFGGFCIDIDNAATFDQAGDANNSAGDLTIQGSAIGACIEGNFEDDSAEPFLVSDWYTNQGNQTGVDPQFVPGTVFPAASSALLNTEAAQQGDRFDKVGYIGAFSGPDDRWTDGWTFQLDETIDEVLN
jgi:hypothetical protein